MTTLDEILPPILLTAGLAGVTTLLLLIIGTPIAWWLARTRSRWREPIAAAVALPLVLPPTVIGFYLLIALGPNGPGGQIAALWGARTLAFSFEGLVIGSILYSLPFIFFVIMLVVFFGRNFVLMFIAVGAVEWLDMARIVRGQTLSIKRQEYVQAAEALGVETKGIIRRHVIPNTLGPVVVYMTLLVPKVILLESFLSFLGLGVQEPQTSWGVLIAEGARAIEAAPHMLAAPAGFLISTLVSLNLLGDGLADAIDPRRA